MVTWDIENTLFDAGKAIVCGVDEAGRGPLAGPVYAAAVIFPPGVQIEGLDDSKKLTAKQRESLYPLILQMAVAFGIGSASEREIDELNIQNATYLAMNRAIAALGQMPDIAMIDGNRSTGIECESLCVVGGDAKSVSIAAASILAKVSRDRYMTELGREYPQYLFEVHKGYPTKRHYEMLREHGISPVHRLTFLKKLHEETGEDL